MDAEEKTRSTDWMVLRVHEGAAMRREPALPELSFWAGFPETGSCQRHLSLAGAGASELPWSCRRLRLRQARHAWSNADGRALLRHGDARWLLILAVGSNAWTLARGEPMGKKPISA